MTILSSIPVNIDSKTDGVTIKLNLFSKGDKPNWRDDFPMEIIRMVGARFTITNHHLTDLAIQRIFLVILKENLIHKIYSPSATHTVTSQELTFAFEDDTLIDVLDNHKAELCKLMIYTNNGAIISEAFDGDKVESQLKYLNNTDHREYRNTYSGNFVRLIQHDNWVIIVNELSIEEREDLLI